MLLEECLKEGRDAGRGLLGCIEQDSTRGLK